jgi:hypothetical protein
VPATHDVHFTSHWPTPSLQSESIFRGSALHGPGKNSRPVLCAEENGEPPTGCARLHSTCSGTFLHARSYTEPTIRLATPRGRHMDERSAVIVLKRI